MNRFEYGAREEFQLPEENLENVVEELYLKNAEILQYHDKSGSLLYEKSGDRMILGPDSDNKFACKFDRKIEDGGNMAIIRKENGDSYGIALGFIIDLNKKNAFRFPTDGFDVTIGKSTNILKSNTDEIDSPVKNVEVFDYLVSDKDASHKVYERSPFIDLWFQADNLQMRLEKAMQKRLAELAMMKDSGFKKSA